MFNFSFDPVGHCEIGTLTGTNFGLELVSHRCKIDFSMSFDFLDKGLIGTPPFVWDPLRSSLLKWGLGIWLVASLAACWWCLQFISKCDLHVMQILTLT